MRRLILLLCLLGSAAVAQDDCTSIEDPVARLACFDKAADVGDSAPPSVSTTAPASVADEMPANRWRLETEVSAMTDQPTVILSANSNNAVMCKQFAPTNTSITFVARCAENTTSFFFYGDCHLASGFQGYGDVTYRLDDGEAQTRSFEVSTDNESLGIWSGGRAIGFLKNLIGKEQMVMRFTPFGMSPVEVKANISGLGEAIKPLREACGW